MTAGLPPEDAQVAPDAATAPRPVVKSAARTLMLLELLDAAERPLRAKEIGKGLGMPPSSTSALLSSLVKLGFLDFEEGSRTYSATERVGALGAASAHEADREAALLGIMADLSEETGATISIAQRNGIHAQYIRVIQATSPLRLHVPTGTCRLLARSAAGFALLASADDIARIIARTNREAAPEPAASESEVAEAVAQLRRDGHFLSDGMVMRGTAHISMPLPPPLSLDRRPLALGIAGPSTEITPRVEALAEAMRRAVDIHIRKLRA